MTTSRTRWTISLLAIAGTLPYLTLKLLWLSGHRIGIADPDFGHGTTLFVANALTMVMDVVAALLALAFVTGWGRRLPARTVLFPMWVGTGLLAPIVLAVPLQHLVPTTADPAREAPLEGWVYLLVHGGFAWQGVFLLAGFALYADRRWGDRLGWRRRAGRTATTGVAAAPALAGTALAAFATATRLPGAPPPQVVGLVVDLAMVAAAAVGLLLLAGRLGARAPGRVGTVLTWTGSAAMAAWATYSLAVLLVPNELVVGSGVRWGDVLLEATRLGAGVLAATTGLALVRRPRAVSGPAPAAPVRTR